MRQAIVPAYDRSPGLWPRRISEGQGASFVPAPVTGQMGNTDSRKGIISSFGDGNAIRVTNSFIPRKVAVTTSQTSLITTVDPVRIMIINPSRSVGLSTSATAYDSTTAVATDTTAASIAVAGYEEAHIFLEVSAIAAGAEWDIYGYVQNPQSTTWMDSQAIFSTITATGNKYAYVGRLGIATDLAFRFNPIVAGAITCRIDVTLKGGTGSGNAGFANAVYIGSDGVTTGYGYPLLPGEERQFDVDANVTVYGIASTTVNVNIFEIRG